MNGSYWDPTPDWIDEPEDDDALVIDATAGVCSWWRLFATDDDSDDA
jgi:hypothetical protein